MAVQTIVGNPERIEDIIELNDTLSRIITYEQERRCHAGVLLTQNLQFGGHYRIESEEEAYAWLTKPVLNSEHTCEWGVKFYPKAYFEGLKKKFESSDA